MIGPHAKRARVPFFRLIGPGAWWKVLAVRRDYPRKASNLALFDPCFFQVPGDLSISSFGRVDAQPAQVELLALCSAKLRYPSFPYGAPTGAQRQILLFSKPTRRSGATASVHANYKG